MIKPWPEIGSNLLANFRIFTIRTNRKVSPRTQSEHDFYVIDCPNWVNVIATTPYHQLVMVEQFRHGTNTVELEIPGGVIDPEDHSPLTAGIRELREETGYIGENAQIIGQNFPNPAIMSNTCYTVLVENCRPTGQLELDHSEDLLTRIVPLPDVKKHALAGEIRHALVLVALYHYDLWLSNRAGR